MNTMYSTCKSQQKLNKKQFIDYMVQKESKPEYCMSLLHAILFIVSHTALKE